jgi:DNA adenine methylase
MIGPLAYIGGKRRIAARLASLLPPHITYVEPFAGGAQVFFHKRPSRVEVLNDLDGEIVNFLRICQRHPRELVRTLRYFVPSRAVFAQLAAQNPRDLTEIERACRLLYLQKNAFGGHVRQRAFHFCVTKPSNFNPARLPTIIDNAARRLQRVQLECWPYERVLERYDRASTFFYVDPPYAGISLYQFNLTDADFRALATRLSGLTGKFLLSINDCELTRRAFSDFDQRQIPIVYTSSRAALTVRELLVANYPMPPQTLLDSTIERRPGTALR